MKPWTIAAVALVATGVAAALGIIVQREMLRSMYVVLPAPEDTTELAAAASAFDFPARPRDLPALHFVDAAGHDHALADLRGHPLVLNVWATWCVPCRKEMPTLDHLQTILAGTDALVVPLSIDSKGVPVVAAFYQEVGIHALGIYVDSSGRTADTLATVGVPTTLLVGRDGREIGRKLGAAVWDSVEMVRLIRARLDVRPSADQAR